MILDEDIPVDAYQSRFENVHNGSRIYTSSLNSLFLVLFVVVETKCLINAWD